MLKTWFIVNTIAQQKLGFFSFRYSRTMAKTLIKFAEVAFLSGLYVL